MSLLALSPPLTTTEGRVASPRSPLGATRKVDRAISCAVPNVLFAGRRFGHDRRCGGATRKVRDEAGDLDGGLPNHHCRNFNPAYDASGRWLQLLLAFDDVALTTPAPFLLPKRGR